MDILQFITPSKVKPVPLALAALAGTASTAGWTQEKMLEPIVVTAQRRAEGLQEVPMSVRVFSAAQIRDAGITSTQEFVDRTPNMSFDHSYTYQNSFVVMRGVTQINNADSPVVVVVDGVPQNNQKQLKMNLFDIERIEVLRGPQGALYGRNAIGGVVSIETRAPRGKSEQFAGAEYGSGDSRELSAGISGVMADGAALHRLAGQSRRSAGQINNAYLGRDVDAVHHDNTLRGKLALHGESTLIDLRLSLNDFSAGANWDSIVRSNNPNDIVAPASNMLGKTTGSTREFSVKAEVDTDLATVTAITAWTDLTERYRGDLDFSNPGDARGGFLGPLPFQLGQGQNLRARMFSQELRLTSPADQPLRWIAGGYYVNTRRDLETRVFADTDSQLSQWDDLAKNVVRLAEANDNNAYAVFGQLDYDIAARTTLSGALRHDTDERHQVNVLNGTRRDKSFDDWQPKLTLTHRIDKKRLAYATYGTGFRSGGFNAPTLPDFKPERLKNVELGFKSSWLDNRLVFNAAAFHSQSRDFQFFHVDAVRAAQVIGNIDKVGIKGVEVDFRFLPTKSLELDGGLGITKSRIRKNSADPTTVGNYAPRQTPWKLNLGAQYTARITGSVNGFARLDYEHRSRKYWHPDNVAVSGPLNLFGLRLGLREIKEKWSLNLFGRNLTDKKYYADYNSAKYSGGVTDIGSLAPPRTIGIEAKIQLH